jgi:hypothetical protein
LKEAEDEIEILLHKQQGGIMTTFTKMGDFVEGLKFTGHNDKRLLAFCPRAFIRDDGCGNLVLTRVGMEEVLVNPGDWIVRNCFGHFKKYTEKELSENYALIYDGALDKYFATYVGPFEFVKRKEESMEEKKMKMTNGEKMVWAAVFAKHYCDLKEEVAFARFPANKAVMELRGLKERGECINDGDMDLVRAFLEDI